ncbi:MAG: cellulase family glycosylhydrolase [Prolixibacteraceae bacterium]
MNLFYKYDNILTLKKIIIMKVIEIAIIVASLVISMSLSAQKNYLHTDGKMIVDGSGNEVILRGMGLGGYMLQEGYMLETSRFAGPQYEIVNTIEKTIGKEGMEEFYKTWRANYLTKQDVDSMAEWGFNSIRLPMHYNLFTLPIEMEPKAGQDTWLETGFEMVDDLLSWCADNQIYLILDLHAAPGGQGKDANISDYDPEKPSLWESAENQRKTYALWKKLADRYANEPWMGAYDILNEPNWDFDNAGNKNGCACTKNELLWEFYEKAISAIREVDQNHIVIIEGNCWGNNYKNAPDPKKYDNNIVVSFHKYWNYNRVEEIQWVLDMRNKYNVPFWLGESGENSNTWFTNCLSLVEANNIGWAWWPYKKINSVTGTVTIPKTEGWQNLLNYWSGKGEEPTKEQATKWLMEQAEMMKLNNCVIHYDVIDAMFRQAQGDKSARPFTANNIPGTICLTNYDLGALGQAYFDTDTCNFRTSTKNSTGWNNGRNYRNDGVDIAKSNVEEGNGFYVGWTEKGEWMQYTCNVTEVGEYSVKLSYATKGKAGKIHLNIDGKNLPMVSLKSTGDDQEWEELALEDITLKKGTQAIKLVIDEGGISLNTLTFKKQ